MSNATVKSHSTLITRNLVPFKGKIPEQIKILKCPNTLKSFFFGCHEKLLTWRQHRVQQGLLQSSELSFVTKSLFKNITLGNIPEDFS